MKRLLLLAVIVALPSIAAAEWKKQQGIKAFSNVPPVTGTIATVHANAPASGISARLQLECFEHPTLGGLFFGIVLDRETAPGPLGWRYQFDDDPPIQRGPFTRLSLTSTSLGDLSSDEVKGLLKAKRLRLTLLPSKGPQLSYEFDVSGSAEAIKSVGCREYAR